MGPLRSWVCIVIVLRATCILWDNRKCKSSLDLQWMKAWGQPFRLHLSWLKIWPCKKLCKIFHVRPLRKMTRDLAYGADDPEDLHLIATPPLDTSDHSLCLTYQSGLHQASCSLEAGFGLLLGLFTEGAVALCRLCPTLPPLLSLSHSEHWSLQLLLWPWVVSTWFFLDLKLHLTTGLQLASSLD